MRKKIEKNQKKYAKINKSFLVFMKKNGKLLHGKQFRVSSEKSNANDYWIDCCTEYSISSKSIQISPNCTA